MENSNWWWCPKCKEAMPQLSPEHYKGECPCQHRKTGKHVDMILVPYTDKRVASTIREIKKEMSEVKTYLVPFHMQVHTGLVQTYVKKDEFQKDGYILGVDLKGGHVETAIDKELYDTFRKTAFENRVKFGYRCRDNPKCPGNDKEFRMVP